MIEWVAAFKNRSKKCPFTYLTLRAKRDSSDSETFLVTFKHCNVATAAVKHLHLCAADVKGLLDAVSHESKKKQSSVSNKSVLPSSFFWMHLRGSIRLGARNGRPKR